MAAAKELSSDAYTYTLAERRPPDPSNLTLPIPVTTIIPTTPQSIIMNCQAKKDAKLLGDSNIGVPQLSMELAASEV